MSLSVSLVALAAAMAADDQPSAALSVSETVVITGRRPTASDVAFETRHALSESEAQDIDATALDELVRQLPAAHVPTNSRGESIVFLRNAAERQVAIFYEGAAINVPWDNRLDLSLFPAGLIGSMRTAAGPLAPHYGVNVLGAVSLSPREARSGGDAALMAGEAELRDVHGSIALPLSEAADLAFGGSYASQDGEPLSDDANLPYSQTDSDLRTNTDSELASFFSRARVNMGGHRLSVTAFHVDAEKGIAPESNRSTGARFWRYPDVSHTLGVASLTSPLGASTTLNSVLWYQRFEQMIDSYTNATYSVINAREEDKDDTYGIRELLTHDVGRAQLVGSFNFLESRHAQRDIIYVAGSPPPVLPAALDYRQRNWSVGGELEYRLTNPLVAELGLGYDSVDYVETGDKPPIRDVGSWTGRAGLIWSVDSHWHLRAAIGRKIRAPTMRELFGQALNRFLINPDLEPERIVTTEVGAEWQGVAGGFYVIPFYQKLDGTIDQRNVGPLRQRVNLVGSSVAGVELGGRYEFGDWQISGDATYAEARRRDVPPGQTDRLAEKPDLLASVRLAYAPKSGFSAAVEAEHVGSAYSADAAGVVVPLESSTSINLQAAYSLALGPGTAELFVHVDNLTDTLIEPQIGLPAPGRWFRSGIRFGW